MRQLGCLSLSPLLCGSGSNPGGRASYRVCAVALSLDRASESPGNYRDPRCPGMLPRDADSSRPAWGLAIIGLKVAPLG